MEFKDYYAALGLERAATTEEIKRAYRKLARKYHPDVSSEPNAEAQFKDVAEAYEVLHDAEKRAAYDSLGDAKKRKREFDPSEVNAGFEFRGRDAGGGEHPDFSDFFESIFGRQHGTGHPRQPMRGAGGDHHARIVINLKDAYEGAVRTLTLRMPTADAHGHIVMEERHLEVKIPKGVREGQTLRLAGQGEPGHAGHPNGDLYLEIAFEPHSLFRVDGRDVYRDLYVSPWEAALGATLPVAMPDGELQLKIPPGSTQGKTLRLKGRGLPGSPPGNAYAVLQVSVPPAVSPEQQQAYAALAQAYPDYNPRARKD
jgi:curved DNA-binding protein